MTVKEVIRLGNALEPYGLAWMEDPVPWWDVEGHKQVTDAINVPTAAGEELYLRDGFREMIEKRAVDIIHPDLLTSGGMVETKTIADYAERYGLPTALHFAGSPIAFMANLHSRRRHPQLRGARAPRPRPALLEGPGDRPARAATWKTATSPCRRSPGWASTST